MDQRERLRMLLIGAGCARCGTPLGAGGVVVLALRDDVAFVQLACDSCRTQTLALVTGVSEAEPEVEPSGRTSSRRSGESPPLTEQDVLDMRTFLEGYRGDLRALLER